MSSKKVRILAEAQLEIEDAFEHYRRESPRIADRFPKVIRSSLKGIKKNPKLYPPYTTNSRRRVLGSFPFSVIYQEKQEIILIVAIAHAKRHEGYWVKRLKR
jgi:plasmid stabilization system protein ParE